MKVEYKEPIAKAQRRGDATMFLGMRNLFLCVSVSLWLILISTASAQLPFTTTETSDTLTIKSRHKVTYNRKTGAVSWKELTIDAPKVGHLELAPGGIDPTSKRPQHAQGKLTLATGEVTGKFIRHEGGRWTSSASLRLEPRNAEWLDPRIKLEGFATDLDLKVSDVPTSGPAPLLQAFSARKFDFASIEAGSFHFKGLTFSGVWTRPDWKAETFRIEDFFGGRIELTGTGTWGSLDPPKVALNVKADGVDLAALLKKFNVPRADEIEGKLKGRLAIESVGREWKVMAFEVAGEEGTVRLNRKFLHDILLTPINQDAAKVDQILNEVFGTETMIPFHEMRVTGHLEPDQLLMQIPLRNDALKIDYETRVDRELLWDAWDYLVNAGVENVKGVAVKP